MIRKKFRVKKADPEAELASGWNFFGSRIPNSDPEDSRSGFFNLDQIENSRKSRNPGDWDRDLKIPKKSRKALNPGDPDRDLEITKKLQVKNPENPE